MNSNSNDANDREFAELIERTDLDVPEPNEAFVAELRARSEELFASRVGIPHQESFWRSNAMRAILGLAAVLVLWAGFHFGINPTEASVTSFGDVLARLESADRLELSVLRDGKRSRVLVWQPGLIRWEDSPAQYRIGRGSRLWKFDEQVGQAALEDANPWFSEDGRIDLLALLDLRPENQEVLLQAEPIGDEFYAGRTCDLYRQQVTVADRAIWIEAFVDRQNSELLGLAAHANQPANGPPLAEMKLVAWNPPFQQDDFQVPANLAQTDHIGKVVDHQGSVALRPIGASRWTPVCNQLLVLPGDWVRTHARGANAVTVDLDSANSFILGPGGLVEVVNQNEVRLHAGTVQVRRSKNSSQALVVSGTREGQDIRLDDARRLLLELDSAGIVVERKSKPKWLAGYESSSAADAMGSLIVTVDGRSQPLSVGEHHVNVEIRDQIARTTIEETFVNHTDERLEGQFHFPLPQDASISGFGMWIGGELVEADIVEKQRAREIYETILREKRDPGLLEWTGGNIFKARVFPIEPHSEKRIKITYTQVLPLQANRFRYSYGLKSEMLQTNPLAELSVHVLVNSSIPLVEVDSPSHTCRKQLTAHSAELEFSAQEYIPAKDFELVCRVNHRENDVVVIPHRRGDNGYFLMQLMPPGSDSDWQRKVIPDGQPLELVLLCDTSGSMDSSKRQQQREFVQSLLTSLGDDDRIQMAVCDVKTEWAFDDFVHVNEETLAAANLLLESRTSLGWTDLAHAFQAVLEKASKHTQVIYIGDGVVSNGESSAAEFVAQLKRMVASDVGVAERQEFPALHAVSVGSTFESIALRGIASHRGSMRSIVGDVTPHQAAFELLNELAQPGLQDVTIEFRGIQVAAVYPERLPNVAAGTQQILVGRYLPVENGSNGSNVNQDGEVVVTGTQDGRPVRFSARIAFSDDSGNSFIPRLWARGRLDALMQQGASPQIQEEIIGLSEEFHIITPYTSLLVLESDEDRERFGVKRRLGMRDGEQFFADGRAAANYELKQKQMREAGSWRLGLRRELLAKLRGLGRVVPSALRSSRGLGVPGQTSYDRFSRSPRFSFGADLFFEQESLMKMDSAGTVRASFDEGFRQNWGFDVGFERGFRQQVDLSVADRDSLASLPALREKYKEASRGESFIDGYAGRASWGATRGGAAYGWDRGRSSYQSLSKAWYAAEGEMFAGTQLVWAGKNIAETRASSGNWIDKLFPIIPRSGNAQPQAKRAKLQSAEALSTNWPQDAIELSKSLLRTGRLAELDSGLLIYRTTSVWDSRFDGLRVASTRQEFWESGRWLTRDAGPGLNSIVNWMDGSARGAFSEAYLLGRRREANERDKERIPFQLADYSISGLHGAYYHYRASLLEGDGSQVVLVLESVENPGNRVLATIDTVRNVLVQLDSWSKGKLNSTTLFSDFKRVADQWFATRVETHLGDADGQLSNLIVQEVRQLSSGRFEREFTKQVAVLKSIQELKTPLQDYRAAKAAIRRGNDSFENQLSLLLYAISRQNWEKAFEQLGKLKDLAPNKPGLHWIEAVVNQTAGRNEDARQKFVELGGQVLDETLPEATGLPAWKGTDRFLANYVLSSIYPITGWSEYGSVVERLRPVYERQLLPLESLVEWKQKWLQVLDNLDRPSEALTLHRELAQDLHGSVGQQTSLAKRLVGLGLLDESLDYIRVQMEKPDHWNTQELTQLREYYADSLESHGRIEQLDEFLADWLEVEKNQTSVFRRYISAQVLQDRVAEAEETVARWLELVRQEGKLTPGEVGRSQAAIEFCQGGGHNLRRHGGITPRWQIALYELAVHCLNRADRVGELKQLANHSSFRQSDEGDKLRSQTLTALKRHLATAVDMEQAEGGDADTAVTQLPIELERLKTLLSILGGGRLLEESGRELTIRNVSQAEWASIADGMLNWWQVHTDELERHILSYDILDVLRRAAPGRALEFLRQRVEERPGKHGVTYRRELFAELQERPWTDSIEDEVYQLWPTTVEATVVNEVGDQVAAPNAIMAERLIPTLMRLNDRVLAKRINQALTQEQDQGDVDETTRAQRSLSVTEVTRAAQSALITRLQTELANAESNDLLSAWIEAEINYYRVQSASQRKDVVEWAWKELGEGPSSYASILDGSFRDAPSLPNNADVADSKIRAGVQSRAWITLNYMAAVGKGREGLIDRLIDYIDVGIERGAAASEKYNDYLDEEALELEVPQRFEATWKSAKYNALVLFDRSDAMIELLKEWIKQEPDNTEWRHSLAKLYAEQGDLSKAITLFESLKVDAELSAGDLKTLATWNLVLDQKSEYETHRRARFAKMSERELASFIQGQARDQNSGGPHLVEVETLLALNALFEKARRPSNYFAAARSVYGPTQDFRVLEMVPQSVLGKTRQDTYNAVTNFHSSLLVDVHQEATLDRLRQRLHELRSDIQAGIVPKGADPNERSQALDLRALDLMEALTEYRAARVPNQPGPHAVRALGKLQSAFEGEWESGERLQYAQFLQSLGVITVVNSAGQDVARLQREQLRQIHELYLQSEKATPDRMQIGYLEALLLYHSYEQQELALERLQVALSEFAEANGGLIPFNRNDLVTGYADLLQASGHFQEAERYLTRHLDAITEAPQRWIYQSQLNSLYERALFSNGLTSLGRQNELFDNVVARLVEQCEGATDHSQQRDLLQLLARLFIRANNTKAARVRDVDAKLLSITDETLLDLLKPEQRYYPNIVSQFGGALREVVGAADALEFLLDRFDSYPARFEFKSDPAWQHHGSQLGQFRRLAEESGRSPERLARLEKRLLPIVLQNLRRQLLANRTQNQAMHHFQAYDYWAAKKPDFIRVTEEVIRERDASPRTQVFAAKYLWSGLNERPRAVKVLLAAEERGLLDSTGRFTLVNYLHDQKRFADSIPLLEPLVRESPDDMSRRVLLIRAYQKSGRNVQLEAAIAAVEEHFHTGGRWTESNIAAYARGLTHAQKYSRAAELFDEAISLHQRARGMVGSTLADYYKEQARVYTLLKNTERAVDAAAAAVVSWGSDQDKRTEAINRLQLTLAASISLEGYIKKLDRESAKTGEDSPLIRKSLGNVLMGKRQYESAIEQFQKSLDLQKFDTEVHHALVQCYDKLEDENSAIEQLLLQADFDRHNLELAVDLARRFKDDPAQAERAATNVVEIDPAEAGAHEALAKLRQRRGQWIDAIPHWRKVTELSKLEPTGLLGLAKAELQIGDREAARLTLDALRSTTWPERFDKVDREIQQLDRQLNR